MSEQCRVAPLKFRYVEAKRRQRSGSLGTDAAQAGAFLSAQGTFLSTESRSDVHFVSRVLSMDGNREDLWKVGICHQNGAHHREAPEITLLKEHRGPSGVPVCLQADGLDCQLQ